MADLHDHRDDAAQAAVVAELQTERDALKSELEELKLGIERDRKRARAITFEALHLVVKVFLGRQLYDRAIRGWDAWSNWLRNPRTAWPEEASRDLLAAVLARFLRMGIIAALAAIIPGVVLVFQTYILNLQTELVEQQTRLLNQQLDVSLRQTNIASFEATSKLRVLLLSASAGAAKQASLPKQADDERPPSNIRLTPPPHTPGEPGREFVPNPSIVLQIATFGVNDEQVENALHTLLKDHSPAVATAALLSRIELARLKQETTPVRAVASNLNRAPLFKANLSNVDLSGSELNDAILRRANLTQTRLDRIQARQVSLHEVQAEGVSFAGAHLEGAGLEQTSFVKASFEGAFLTGAELTRSTFDGINARGAVFVGATLTEVSLRSADLSGADLRTMGVDAADQKFLEGARLDLARVSPSFAEAHLSDEQLARSCVDFRFARRDSDWKGTRLEHYKPPLDCKPDDLSIPINRSDFLPLSGFTGETLAKLYLWKELIQDSERVTIGGHSDSRGIEEYNLQATNRMAAAIKRALIELEVEREKLMTVGYGETRPLVQPVEDRRNNRVELTW